MDETEGVVRMNCRNCGAPMKNGRCEYCGTQADRNVQSTLVMTCDGIRLTTVVVDAMEDEKTWKLNCGGIQNGKTWFG